MGAHFPSGGWGASGKLVEDPAQTGLTFVPDRDSWAADTEPREVEKEAYTLVPEPEEVIAPNHELEEATELAHNVHEFTEWAKEDPESAKELNEAFKEAAADTHQGGKQQPEFQAAGETVEGTQVPNDMGVNMSPVHATVDMAGALLWAGAAAALGAKAVSEFLGKEADDSPREVAPEAQAEEVTPQPEPSPAAEAAPLPEPVPVAEAQPSMPMEAEHPAPTGADAPATPMPDVAAEEHAFDEAETALEAATTEPSADQRSEPEARQSLDAAHEASSGSGKAAPQQDASHEMTSPSVSPSFGSF